MQALTMMLSSEFRLSWDVSSNTCPHQQNTWRTNPNVRATVKQCKLTLKEHSCRICALSIFSLEVWWDQNPSPFTECVSSFILTIGTGKTIVHDWFSSNLIINPMWTARLSTSSKSLSVPLSTWLKHQPSPALHYCGQENLKWNKLAPVCSNSTSSLRVHNFWVYWADSLINDGVTGCLCWGGGRLCPGTQPRWGVGGRAELEKEQILPV